MSFTDIHEQPCHRHGFLLYKKVSEVESASDILMCLLFLLKVLLELVDASLQVAVNLNVSTNDAFHPTDVLIDVILDGADTLDI